MKKVKKGMINTIIKDMTKKINKNKMKTNQTWRLLGVVGEARVALPREGVLVVAHPRTAHVWLLVAELVHWEPAMSNNSI